MNTEEESSKIIRSKKEETGEKLFKERRERMKNFNIAMLFDEHFSMLSDGKIIYFILSVFSLFSECPFCGEVLF